MAAAMKIPWLWQKMPASRSGFFIPRAVIFDWDNTLIDSWGAIGEAVNETRAHFGLQVWNRREILANCTRSARESFPDWFGDKWQEAWDRYYNNFNKIRSQTGLHVLDGGRELVAWLKEKDIPSMVVSNKSGPILRQEVEQLGWQHYFASVVGAHDAARDKPARAHADMALDQAGLKPSADILFIGDSETDIACARNVGCTPCLVGKQETAKFLDVALFSEDCAEILDQLKRL